MLHSKLRVGGMLVGYYLICPRKAWLSMRGLWMEQESQVVQVGRLIDQESYGRRQRDIMLNAEAPDGTSLVGKIDRARLKHGVLHEVKKSRSCEEAHVWQLRFYLWLLERCGVTRSDGGTFTGQLDYPKLRRTERVELRPEHARRLEEVVMNLQELAAQERPPPRVDKRKFCAQCAFEELCYG